MRSNALLWFLPTSMLPLVLAGGAALVIVGLLRPGRLLAIVAAIALAPLLTPLIDVLLDQLPWWLLAVVVIGMGFSIAKAAATLLLGESAAISMIGSLAASAAVGLVRFVVMIPLLLVRLLVRIVRS